MDNWLTIHQFCKRHNIPAPDINKWIDDNRVHAKVIDGEICININSFLTELWKENVRLKKQTAHYRHQNMSLMLHYRNLEAIADKLAVMPKPNINLLKENIKILMIPEEDKRLLQSSVDCLKLNPRLFHFFKTYQIFTIEDLLRYLKIFGWDEFLKFRNFGKISLESLKSELIRMNVMNKNMECRLMKYIIV